MLWKQWLPFLSIQKNKSHGTNIYNDNKMQIEDGKGMYVPEQDYISLLNWTTLEICNSSKK